MPQRSSDSDFGLPANEEEFRRRIICRCVFFEKAFDLYQTKLVALGFEAASMNRVLLLNCLESYFLDIMRLKIFHKMERADRFKRAGFMLKWFCKIRPIQVGPLVGLTPGLRKRGMLVNADFALIQALSIAGVKRVDERLIAALLYTAHYRDFEGSVMALEMATLARAASPMSSATAVARQ